MNIKVLVNQLNTFLHLLRWELYVLLKDIHNGFLDVAIIVGSSVFCNAYVLSKMGVAAEYGSMIAVGWITSIGIFEAFDAGVVMVVDFEHTKTCSYELMLPLPSWMIFLKTAIARAVKASLVASIILPLSKILIWHKLDFDYFSIYRFCLAYFLINCLAGSLAILSASLNTTALNANRVWVRYFHPMWMFGGAIFPYKATVAAFPVFSKILLLNPFVYTTEILYSSVLSSSCHYLSYTYCAVGLVLFAVSFFVIGFFRLKARLNFI